MLISMGERNVGRGTPVFIVFEAGPTHTGLESAKQLATYAKQAGADAIKFQIADFKRLIRDRSLQFNYQAIDAQGNIFPITEPLYDIWQRRWMPSEDWRALKAHCDAIGICFFATIFSPEDVDLVRSLGVHSLKIASQDTNYQDLIEYAADTGLPIQLDTGGSSLGEVERAVDWIRERGNDKILINHCPSGYPARLESIHLRMIRTLKGVFPYPVAFSDHNPGWEIDVAAVAVGADIVEKTITLDRTQRSCEHMFSLEPDEMAQFVQILRTVETALGSERRVIAPEQRKARDNVRRSAYLVRDVKAGEIFTREDIAFMRPGHGICPDEYRRFLGLAYGRDIPAGANLNPDDF
jgi:N,N'-diacetyllegionaminate synthase